MDTHSCRIEILEQHSGNSQRVCTFVSFKEFDRAWNVSDNIMLSLYIIRAPRICTK
jgi:hypothetical protein